MDRYGKLIFLKSLPVIVSDTWITKTVTSPYARISNYFKINSSIRLSRITEVSQNCIVFHIDQKTALGVFGTAVIAIGISTGISDYSVECSAVFS